MNLPIEKSEDLISATALFSELGLHRNTNESQRTLLAKYGVVAALARPWSRGYMHYVTPEDAEKIRRRVQREQQKSAAPSAVVVPLRTQEDALGKLAGQVAALTGEMRQMRADLGRLLKALE